MTLIITALNPFVGAWQSADASINYKDKRLDERWCKQAFVLCSDGWILLGCSGLANLPDNYPIAYWVADQAITPPGPVDSVERFLLRLKRNLTQLWTDLPTDFHRITLTVCCAVFVGGGRPAMSITVGNRDAVTKEPRPSFELVIKHFTDQSFVGGQGSGASRVLESNRNRLLALTVGQTQHLAPKRVLGALLSSTDRAQGKDVTPWGQAVFVSSQDIGRIIIETRIPPQARLQEWVRPIRLIMVGVDHSMSVEGLQALERPRYTGKPHHWFIDVDKVTPQDDPNVPDVFPPHPGIIEGLPADANNTVTYRG